jgi:hypothetical protein
MGDSGSGYVGGYTGDASGPGNAQRQLVVNGQALARYGMATPATGGIAQSTLDVSLNAPPLSGG